MCETFKKVTKKQEKPSILLFITIKNIYKQKYFLDNDINISWRKISYRRMSMERLIYFAPVLGICALLFAFYLTKKVGKQDAGTDRMKEIAAFIHEGARAFLTA